MNEWGSGGFNNSPDMAPLGLDLGLLDSKPDELMAVFHGQGSEQGPRLSPGLREDTGFPQNGGAWLLGVRAKLSD